MTVSIVVVSMFFIANIALAAWRRQPPSGSGADAGRATSSAVGYALDGRRLSGPVLLATLAASNLSAFTVLGVSGASYRLGWTFFPVMAFGTAFMAVSFAVIGVPLRRMSAERGWTTPGEFIADRFGRPWLGRLFSGLSLAYTIPYLAIQAGAGGRLLEGMTGIPRIVSSALLMAVVAAYVWRGGMRSVARTDILQLAALLVLAVAAGIIVAAAAGRSAAVTMVDADRMSRAGVGGTLGWLPLLGYYVLWAFADPMFPHFIQRFYAARSDRALLSSMVAYPAVAVLVFLPVCAIGVLGSVLAPGLEGAASDGVFTVLTRSLAGPVLGPVFSLAVLAALMSTMDSQLLSCASMLGIDFLPSRQRGSWGSSTLALALAVIAWLVSIRPPLSILDFLNKTAFPGYATLMPVALAGIYAPNIGHRTAAATLAAGTALVVLETSGLFVPPVPVALFNAGVQFLVIAAGIAIQFLSTASSKTASATVIGSRGRLAVSPGPFVSLALMASAAAIVALGFLGVDFWNYGDVPIVIPGMPAWVVYHAVLTLSLCGAFGMLSRSMQKGRA